MKSGVILSNWGIYVNGLRRRVWTMRYPRLLTPGITFRDRIRYLIRGQVAFEVKAIQLHLDLPANVPISLKDPQISLPRIPLNRRFKNHPLHRQLNLLAMMRDTVLLGMGWLVLSCWFCHIWGWRL